MNQKEVSELRRRFRPDKSAVSRIYGCYVNSSREIVSYLDESLGSMPQDEVEKYLSLLKRSLSGTLGRNLIDLVFSTQQVADSEEHRLLMSLRDSKLKDHGTRERFYRKVIDSLELEESGYLILLVHDDYDVPRRAKDDTVMRDASDEVFSYLLCCVCPIKERKAELGFFPADNEFHTCGGQVVSAPSWAFCFPPLTTGLPISTMPCFIPGRPERSTRSSSTPYFMSSRLCPPPSSGRRFRPRFLTRWTRRTRWRLPRPSMSG